MDAYREDNVADDRFTEAPEADAAEQATAVAPDDADLDLDTIERATARSIDRGSEADAADVWEQNLPVADEDDGYDHD